VLRCEGVVEKRERNGGGRPQKNPPPPTTKRTAEFCFKTRKEKLDIDKDVCKLDGQRGRKGSMKGVKLKSYLGKKTDRGENKQTNVGGVVGGGWGFGGLMGGPNPPTTTQPTPPTPPPPQHPPPPPHHPTEGNTPPPPVDCLDEITFWTHH